MAGTTITVNGMTCEHCVSSVTEEIGAIPGVTGVDVDLPTGRVDISGEGPIDPAALEAAVDEAGYTIAS